MVTVYTVVSTNLLTAEIGRGRRGIEIDTKEVMAMRNIVHFNCINPFTCRCLRAETRTTPTKLKTQDHNVSDTKAEKSFYAKNPYGDISQLENRVPGRLTKMDRSLFVML